MIASTARLDTLIDTSLKVEVTVFKTLEEGSGCFENSLEKP
jgi:hypothetical protein